MTPWFAHSGAVVSKARRMRRADGSWLSPAELSPYLSLVEAEFASDIAVDAADGHHPAWKHSRVWSTKAYGRDYGILVVRCCQPLREAILARVDEAASADGLRSGPA